MAKETDNLLLNKYVQYIKKLAEEKSPEMFTNGGIEYASQLMSVLFENTEKEARIFCKGFRPDLIMQEPYWSSLLKYVKDPSKSLFVLVESDDALHLEPLNLLRRERNKRRDNSIEFRLITQDDRSQIFDELDGSPCNFAIFDDNKFRYEYDCEGFKAFGSFNREDYSRILISLFDKAFRKATVLN